MSQLRDHLAGDQRILEALEQRFFIGCQGEVFRRAAINTDALELLGQAGGLLDLRMDSGHG